MMGENVGRAFVSLHANGDDVPDEIGDAMDKMTPAFKKAGKDHAKAYDDAFQDENGKSTDNFLKSFADKLHKTLPEWKKVETQADRNASAIRRLTTNVDDNDSHSHRWLTRLHEGFEKWNGSMDRSATKVGKIFGKGSRNDFVNIVGSVVEGLTRLVRLVPQAGEKLTGMLKGEGGGGGLVKMFTGLAGAGVAGAVALAAVAAAAGPIGALLTGVAAAVISLAGSLVFAAGAIGGVALALTGPLAVGIGVVVAALVGMDDQTRKTIFKSVDPLIDRFKKAGDAAGEAFGPKFAKAIDSAGPALSGLEGFFGRVGSAIGDVTIQLTEMTQSEGFANFKDAFGKFIPDALEQLGEIAGNTLGGIGGIMEAAIPITEEFLGWLTKITGEFSNWANSKEGQEELMDFFDRAADSARAVGDFLGEATGALAELFSQAKGEGDTIFKDMADQLERFANYLSNPKNKEAIDDFFSNGVHLARELGNLALDIGDAIDELDSPQARKFLSFLIDAIGTGLKLFGSMVQEIADVEHALLGMAVGAGRAIRNFFSGASREASELSDKILGFFKGLGGRIVNVIGKVDMTQLFKDPTGTIIGWFQGLAGRILNVIGSIDIGSLVKGGGILSHVPGLASGGITSGPSVRLIGEAGPEAVVPLNRPLSQVDPSVRGLSAIAQGYGGGGGTTIADGAIRVYEAVNGRATAQALLNTLVARAI